MIMTLIVTIAIVMNKRNNNSNSDNNNELLHLTKRQLNQLLSPYQEITKLQRKQNNMKYRNFRFSYQSVMRKKYDAYLNTSKNTRCGAKEVGKTCGNDQYEQNNSRAIAKENPTANRIYPKKLLHNSLIQNKISERQMKWYQNCDSDYLGHHENNDINIIMIIFMDRERKKLTLIAYGTPISSTVFGDNSLPITEFFEIVAIVDSKFWDDLDVPNFCHLFNDRNML